MKRKFMLPIAMIFLMVLVFSACGKKAPEYYYLTLTPSEYCEINIEGAGRITENDQTKLQVTPNSTVTIRITPYEMWQAGADFLITLDGEPVPSYTTHGNDGDNSIYYAVEHTFERSQTIEVSNFQYRYKEVKLSDSIIDNYNLEVVHGQLNRNYLQVPINQPAILSLSNKNTTPLPSLLFYYSPDAYYPSSTAALTDNYLNFTPDPSVRQFEFSYNSVDLTREITDKFPEGGQHLSDLPTFAVNHIENEMFKTICVDEDGNKVDQPHGYDRVVYGQKVFLKLERNDDYTGTDITIEWPENPILIINGKEYQSNDDGIFQLPSVINDINVEGINIEHWETSDFELVHLLNHTGKHISNWFYEYDDESNTFKEILPFSTTYNQYYLKKDMYIRLEGNMQIVNQNEDLPEGEYMGIEQSNHQVDDSYTYYEITDVKKLHTLVITAEYEFTVHFVDYIDNFNIYYKTIEDGEFEQITTSQFTFIVNSLNPLTIKFVPKNPQDESVVRPILKEASDNYFQRVKVKSKNTLFYYTKEIYPTVDPDLSFYYILQHVSQGYDLELVNY